MKVHTRWDDYPSFKSYKPQLMYPIVHSTTEAKGQKPSCSGPVNTLVWAGKTREEPPYKDEGAIISRQVFPQFHTNSIYHQHSGASSLANNSIRDLLLPLVCCRFGVVDVLPSMTDMQDELQISQVDADFIMHRPRRGKQSA